LKSINDIDLKSKMRSELIEEQYNLKCDKCKTYIVIINSESQTVQFK